VDDVVSLNSRSQSAFALLQGSNMPHAFLSCPPSSADPPLIATLISYDVVKQYLPMLETIHVDIIDAS
jgi:hypothetical protein